MSVFLSIICIVLAIVLAVKIKENLKLKKENQNLKDLILKMEKFSKAGLKIIQNLQGDKDENFKPKG